MSKVFLLFYWPSYDGGSMEREEFDNEQDAIEFVKMQDDDEKEVMLSNFIVVKGEEINLFKEDMRYE